MVITFSRWLCPRTSPRNPRRAGSDAGDVIGSPAARSDRETRRLLPIPLHAWPASAGVVTAHAWLPIRKANAHRALIAHFTAEPPVRPTLRPAWLTARALPPFPSAANDHATAGHLWVEARQDRTSHPLQEHDARRSPKGREPDENRPRLKSSGGASLDRPREGNRGAARASVTEARCATAKVEA